MKSNNATLPPENIPQPEDMKIEHIDSGFDDSNVPIQAVIENIIVNVAPKGFVVGSSGGLEVDADAENLKLMVAIRNWDVGSDKKKPTAFMLIISGVITTQMILLTRINCTFGHFIHFIKGKKGKIQNIFFQWPISA